MHILEEIKKRVVSKNSASPDRVAFAWLLHFRWVTAASQIFLITVAYRTFEVNISLFASGILVGMVILSNIFFYLRQRHDELLSNRYATAAMFFDIGLLTILFLQMSCSLNPFTILYIVYVVLGAIILKPKSAKALILFSVLCYSSFFMFSDPMFMDEELMHRLDMAGLLPPEEYLGAFTSFTENIEEYLTSYTYLLYTVFLLTVAIIGATVIRLNRAIEKQQKTINELEKHKSRTEKLAALATFAAGAAHEFSTPLSTIAVVSGEMLNHFRRYGGDAFLIEDTKLVREQVNRCKEILYQMAADAGEPLGENAETFMVRDLVDQTLELFDPAANIRFINNVGNTRVTMPIRTLIRNLRGILKNAIDASDPDYPIFLTCRLDEEYLHFEVQDYGQGMDDETLARAAEPFYTTKSPGNGMGLGLYLVRTFADNFGGKLDYKSVKGKGTTMVMSFGREKIQARDGKTTESAEKK